MSGTTGRRRLSAWPAILAAAVDGDDAENDAEPYFLTCGEWVHMFHGVEGWRHFRGEPGGAVRRGA